MKSLKEGRNLAYSPSLRDISSSSLLAACVSGPVFESWETILGPPLAIPETLREFNGLECGRSAHGTCHPKSPIGICEASLAHPY